MISGGKAEKTIKKLLTLANQSLEEARLRLADLEAAKQSAEQAVQGLAETIRTEELARREDAVSAANTNGKQATAQGASADLQMMAFTEATRDRRTALRETIVTLDNEIHTAREGLREAMAETVKLEHLIAVAAKAQRSKQRRREQSELDAAARSRQTQSDVSEDAGRRSAGLASRPV